MNKQESLSSYLISFHGTAGTLNISVVFCIIPSMLALWEIMRHQNEQSAASFWGMLICH